MNRPRLVGATAAAMLPAALSAAVLVSAPFAGTTTAPLADAQHLADAQAALAGAQQRLLAAPQSRSWPGLSLHVPATAVAALAGFELCLVGIATGVIVTARRRATGD